MKRSSFIIIETYHERYSFSQEIYYRKHTTIEKVLDEFRCGDANTGKDELVVRPYSKDGFWTIDRSCNSTKVYDEEHEPYIRKHIETVAIIDLKYLKKEEYVNNIFCQTESKFGMFDCDERKLVNGNKN